VITGASSGIGRATVEALAADFGRITLVGRDTVRHHPVLSVLLDRGVDARLVEADLGALQTVAAAASVIEGPCDVVIANAGVAGGRGITVDGFEMHFGVNHLAHHLLLTELAPLITDRVVIVSSNAHYDSGGLDFERLRRKTPSLTGFREYRDSKAANVLCGREMARRYDWAVHLVHPGLVATDIWRKIPWPIRPLVTRKMATPDEGADTPVWAATEPDLTTGGYYSRRTLREPSPQTLDDAMAARLWERSEEWLTPFRKGQI
jgi:NAD(P)-dependent dehydrogenase (short-subunit alcohol dehydrogenase family)